MPFLLARVCPRGTGDGTRALGLGLTAPLVPWLVCAPYGRAAAGRAPPGTSWGLCLPALAPLYAPKPPLPLGGPAGESGWGRANTGCSPSSALWHFSAYTCTESLEADRAHHKSIRPWRRLSRRPATAIADVAASALVPRMDAVVVRLGGEPNSRAQLAKRRPCGPASAACFPVVPIAGQTGSRRELRHVPTRQGVRGASFAPLCSPRW